jgi:hypothetical protein
MHKPRKLTPAPLKRAASAPSQWNQLMRKALTRAQEVGDSRVGSLQQALREGTVEKTLRRMSIVCDADIAREFPDPKT